MEDKVKSHDVFGYVWCKGIPGMTFGWRLTSGDGTSYPEGSLCGFRNCNDLSVEDHGFCIVHERFLMDRLHEHGFADEMFWVREIHTEYERLRKLAEVQARAEAEERDTKGGR